MFALSCIFLCARRVSVVGQLSPLTNSCSLLHVLRDLSLDWSSQKVLRRDGAFRHEGKLVRLSHVLVEDLHRHGH